MDMDSCAADIATRTRQDIGTFELHFSQEAHLESNLESNLSTKAATWAAKVSLTSGGESGFLCECGWAVDQHI